MPNSTVKFITSKGEITMEVFEDRTPVTAANFLDYVRSGRASRGAAFAADAADRQRTEQSIVAGTHSTEDNAAVPTASSWLPASPEKEAEGYPDTQRGDPLSPAELRRLRASLKQLAEGVLGK